MIFSIAQLTSDQLRSVEDLEKQIGHRIVALRGLQGEPAQISDDALSALRSAEESLGLTLVVVNDD